MTFKDMTRVALLPPEFEERRTWISGWKEFTELPYRKRCRSFETLFVGYVCQGLRLDVASKLD